MIDSHELGPDLTCYTSWDRLTFNPTQVRADVAMSDEPDGVERREAAGCMGLSGSAVPSDLTRAESDAGGKRVAS